MRTLFDDFLDKLVEKLSQKNQDKKAILLTPGTGNDTTDCYNKTIERFFQKCAGKDVRWQLMKGHVSWLIMSNYEYIIFTIFFLESMY